MTGWDWEAVGDLDFSAGTMSSPSLGFGPDGTPYVGFADGGDAWKARVMKFDGAKWAIVGGAGFSVGRATAPVLAITDSGTLYVGYQDVGGAGTVMKFSGDAWSAVGTAGFTGGYAITVSMAAAPDGTPYFGFQNGANGPAQVLRYTGSSWSAVGGTGFPTGAVYLPSLEFGPDGTLYFAYVGDDTKATVMSYNGDGWQGVGAPGFSAGNASYISVRVAPDGVPHVVFDGEEGVTVMKYSQGSWTWVGNKGEIGGGAYPTLRFAPDGQPYVVFRDSTNKATVKRFAGGAWTNVGRASFSPGTIYNPALAIASDGTPYVAIQDEGNGLKALVMKMTAPTQVTHVAVPPAKSYGVAEQMTFQVTFSTSVIVTGAPQLLLHLANGDFYASYQNGSGTNTLVFTYTVRAGDDAPGGISLGSEVELNGATIMNSDGLAALLPVADVEPTTNVKVVTPAPSFPAPVVGQIGANQATLTFTSSASGTGYFILLKGSAPVAGNGVQTRAGTDGAGAPAVWVGSLALTAGVPASYTVRNLLAGQEYAACFTSEHSTSSVISPFQTSDAESTTDVGWMKLGKQYLPGLNPVLAFSPDGTPYVAYTESLTDAVKVSKYANGAWSPVGPAQISEKGGRGLQLACSPDGTIYLSYSDDAYDGKLTVVRFDSDAWRPVGDPGFSAGAAVDPSLGIAPDGIPYVAYQTAGLGQHAVVMKYIAGVWIIVGSAEDLPYGAAPQLAFGPDGATYIAFGDDGGSLSVMKFDGGWKYVGQRWFNQLSIFKCSLAFSPDGVPYVCYGNGLGQRISVWKFSAGEWGPAGPDFGSASSTTLAFGSEGAPYVAYEDVANNIRTSVRRLAGDEWVTVGEPGFSDSSFEFPTIVFAPDGTPHVAGTYDRLFAVRRMVPLPVVTKVHGPAAATYGKGSILQFAVDYSRAVNVDVATGLPSLPISLGDKVVNARYTTGAGGSTLTFEYTVQAGDVASGGIELGSALTLYGGSITDASTDLPARLALHGVDALNGVKVLGSAPAALPIAIQPQTQFAAIGETITLTTSVADNASVNFLWERNGATVTGGTGSTLRLASVQPSDAGIYNAVAFSATAETETDRAIVGVATTSKVVGAGLEIGSNILHPNGNVFDQVLLNGVAEAITADWNENQVTRTSFIDLNDNIVQVEFSGPGTLSLGLDQATGPAQPVNYTQAVNYMKGHAGIVITGATEQTNLSVFSVGRATAFDPTGTYDIIKPISATNNPAKNGSPLFVGHASTNYGGIADIAFVAIISADGKFGGIRTANANYFASKGYTGIYAPSVQFTGPVYIGNITAFDTATPVILLGQVDDARVTGGDLSQDEGRPVQVSGLKQLKFTAGVNSSGNPLPARANKAVLRQDGVDVTAQIVVNPSP